MLAVTVPERPGSFRKFCRTLGRRSVTEFNYRYADATEAHVFAGIELRRGDEERRQIIEKLTNACYPVVDLTFNEMAKLHTRYMVGGHAENIENELLYRFEFPERPGALLDFLSGMGRNWNISLFHYRNHGSAFGRVLTGIQVPVDERENFQQFLDSLGYSYFVETDNPAYRAFLA